MKACVETLLGGGSGHSAAGVLFGAENEQSMAVPRHSCGRVRCGTRISKNGTPVRMWKQMAVLAVLRVVSLSVAAAVVVRACRPGTGVQAHSERYTQPQCRWVNMGAESAGGSAGDGMGAEVRADSAATRHMRTHLIRLEGMDSRESSPEEWPSAKIQHLRTGTSAIQ